MADMQVHLKALGCRLNEAELETWGRDFRRRGLEVTADPAAADLVVVNTCAVTGEAARKSRQLIRRVHRRNPRAKLIVSGCAATLAPDEVAALDGVDLLIDNERKGRLVDIASRELELPTMPAAAAEPGATPLFSRGRHRAFVKIQDGCRYRCSFCIVTLARGEERSRPEADVVTEINHLVESGVKEAVLTGVHIGGYGSDRGSDLTALIRRVLQETDLPRLRLGSVEPWDLPEDFFTLFEDARFMPHLHLPLQSGSDTVLKRMARRCKSAEFERLAASARDAVPGLEISTDIIVGFPGETGSDWEQTLAYCERLDFSHIHIFPYSARAGTKAAGFPGQVSEAVKRERSRSLHELTGRMQVRALGRRVGQQTEILWEEQEEGPDGARRYVGYMPSYLRAALRIDGSTPKLENRIASARIVGIDEACATARAELIA
jgi:threonylcarbamoyladenosine tRNA methylthiotransferase MtaB